MGGVLDGFVCSVQTCTVVKRLNVREFGVVSLLIKEYEFCCPVHNVSVIVLEKISSSELVALFCAY